MFTFNRFAAALGLVLACAQAQAVSFSFTSGAGTITDTATGLTITSSAWSNTAAGNRFEAAKLSFAADGMGVYNRTENTKGNGNTFDTLGNSKGVDLVLFRFSSAVSLTSLNLLQVGKDSDLSMWAGSGALSPSGQSAGALGRATLYDNISSAGGIRNVSLGAFTGTYEWLAVAARTTQIDDLVKLQSLTLHPASQPVPEPDTWIMLLAGLGLVGFAVSRRTRA